MLEKFMHWSPDTARAALVHPTSVLIGRVKLAEGVSVWPNAVLRADVAEITVGKNTSVQDCCVIHVDLNVPAVIGEGVTMGHGAVVHSSKIGNRCLIGMKAVVMDSEIGDDCLIAAGTVITPGKKIPAGSLVMGVPGKIVRKLTPDELKSLVKAAEDYTELSRHYTEPEK